MCYKQYQLALHRIAKVQINTFGHSDTSGLPNIDYFITSKLFESNVYNKPQDNYSEKLIKMKSMCTCYPNIIIKVEEKEREEFSGFACCIS